MFNLASGGPKLKAISVGLSRCSRSIFTLVRMAERHSPWVLGAALLTATCGNKGTPLARESPAPGAPQEWRELCDRDAQANLSQSFNRVYEYVTGHEQETCPVRRMAPLPKNRERSGHDAPMTLWFLSKSACQYARLNPSLTAQQANTQNMRC